jgi:glycosyltransferase involved in cell wall biosynthesis
MKIGYGDGGIPENLRRWPWLFIILPFFLLSLALHTIVLARNCDVIHANWLFTGLFSLPAKLIRKKPLVMTLRGSDLRKGSSKLLSLIIAGVDAITTVNKKWSDDLQEKYDFNSRYIPNGVEISELDVDPRRKFGIGNNEVIALYIGALRKVKGADVLAEAAKITMALNPSLRFLVVGPGDPQKFGLNDRPNVICTGGIPPHEALGIFTQCDIFVLPSRLEGRPNALLEAMASGLPSVATRLPGVIEVLTEEAGILVDTEDPRALAEAVCSLAKNPAARKSMGRKAKARISELSLDWQSSAREYSRIFEEVCSCAG